MTTSIRPATPQDFSAVCKLWQCLTNFHRSIGLAFISDDLDQATAAWQASFERTLGRFSFLWVAETERGTQGFLLARLKRAPAYLGGELIGEISDLWVDPELRHQGVAAALVQFAMQQFQTLQVHSVEVQIMAANTQAIAFWQAQGFKPELLQVRHLLSSEPSNA
jgi:ribosomal protein S18 acetylase RimI-like enzyme